MDDMTEPAPVPPSAEPSDGEDSNTMESIGIGDLH